MNNDTDGLDSRGGVEEAAEGGNEPDAACMGSEMEALAVDIGKRNSVNWRLGVTSEGFDFVSSVVKPPSHGALVVDVHPDSSCNTSSSTQSAQRKAKWQQPIEPDS